jgi:hypothetical protein
MIGRPCVLAIKPVALAALLASTGAIGQARQPVTVELHHRSAESLLIVLRPLIGPAALAGAGMHLQVRAPPADLARVVRLIEQSDRPLQPLVVSLREDPPSFAPAADLDAPARHGPVTLSTGRPLAADLQGNGQVLSTQTGPPPVPVVEGDPLMISMPAPQSLWFGVRGGKAAGRPSMAPSGAKEGGGSTRGPDAAGLVPFDAVSDFTARIWVAGQTVAIDLQPRQAGRVSGAYDAGADHQTVYGRAGQWIALADSGTQLPSAGVAESGAPRAGLWIKVEVAPSPPARQ